MAVEVDLASGSVRRSGHALHLPARQVALLAVFATAGRRVVGRDELRRRLGLGRCDPRRCDALISELRRSLGPSAIVTVRGRGWRCAEVVSAAGPPV